MKTMTIEVPQNGASIKLVLRAGVPSSQAVIVAADEVEIRLGDPAPGSRATAPQGKANGKPSGEMPLDLDAISANLLRLRPKKRIGALNAIRTMFQFTNPITAAVSNQILEDLRRRGDLSITPEGAIEFHNHKAP